MGGGETQPHYSLRVAKRGGWEGLGRFFSIRKSYFLQVKSPILVGTLQKYQFLILIIPKNLLNFWG
ncbi:hypothetical protein LBK9_05585 [Leptospira borgpetersenii serovar Hardjo]|nr:hypothetical protein LBK9_05585 [Leptospira borgpetersenii serovar Hardjo]